MLKWIRKQRVFLPAVGAMSAPQLRRTEAKAFFGEPDCSSLFGYSVIRVGGEHLLLSLHALIAQLWAMRECVLLYLCF